MTITFGFYNSIEGDRRYDAIQMTSIFDGVILDGVFASVGTAMIVQPSTGMDVIVGEGRAWFNHTWTLNDTPLVLTLDPPSMISPRIDAIVLEIDANVAVRANTIKVLTGEVNSYPQRPTWINTTTKHTYPLAYISVPVGLVNITNTQITNMVGTSACPFVISPVTGVNVDTLLAQWNGQFGVWFQEMKDQLSTDAAGNLQNEIDALVIVDASLQTQINNFSNNISDGAVHQHHLDSGASKVIARQGGSSTDWGGDYGASNYTPQNAAIQVGTFHPTDGNGNFVVTFPVGFSGKPVVLLTVEQGFIGWATVAIVAITSTGFSAKAIMHTGGSPYHIAASNILPVMWMAIGPLA